jgi:APA family basic amino acid/polyamine antiporter
MAKAPMFVRDATGLVRQLGASDVFLWLFTFMGLFAYWPFTVCLLYFYGGGVGFYWPVVIGLGCLQAIITVSAYSMATIVMPRSGGTYVWTSRSLTPSIGFVSRWAWFITELNTTASGAWFAAGWGLPVALGIMATYTKDPMYTNWSKMVADPMISTILGIIFVIGTGVFIAVGLKWVKWATIFIAVITWIPAIIYFWLIFTSSPGQFKMAFDAVSTTSYEGVISAAQKGGIVLAPSLAVSFLVVPYMVWGTAQGTEELTVMGGEIKRPNRSLLVGYGSYWIVHILLISAMLVAGLWIFGNDFYSSLNYLYWTNNAAYPFGTAQPTLHFLVGFLTNNPLIWGFFAFAIFLGSFDWLIVRIPYISRELFAWSFDRIGPAKFAEINDTFGSPLYAVLIAIIGACVFVPFYMYNWLGPFVNAFIVNWVCMGIWGIAIALIPFRRKEAYEASTMSKFKIGRIPLITIVGLCATASFILLLTALVILPSYQAAWTQWAFTAALFASGVVVYYLVYSYRKKQGIDLRMILGEIPPE